MISAGRGTCGAVAMVAGALVVSQLRRTFREVVGTFTKRMPTRPVKSCQTTSPESRIKRCVAGQSELKINAAIGRKLLLALKGPALFAEIDQGRGNLLDVGIVESGVGMYRDAVTSAALALHQGTGGAQAAPGAVFGNRLV